jgi:hypothetical protein
MARAGTRILDVGHMFPDLKLKLIDGSEIQTKTGLKHSWNAVLVYRGAWCPFCISQPKSFQIGLEKLEAEGIGVLAISTEPLEKARETQKATGATFPIAYEVPVVETAEVIGALLPFDVTRCELLLISIQEAIWAEALKDSSRHNSIHLTHSCVKETSWFLAPP